MTDMVYKDKRSARGKTSQVGSHIQFWDQRPSYYRLKVFEKMFYQDSVINKALITVVDSVLASVGSVTHPDQEIADYHNYMLSSIEDATSKSIKSLLGEFLVTKLWAGFSVAEINFSVFNGSLVLSNLITYNPRSISIRTNDSGVLTDNEKTTKGLNSGIYQSGYNTVEVRLPLWKVMYSATQAMYGDYLGRSILAPAYKWYRLKDHVLDLMITTLGRGSSPLSYLAMRSYEIDEDIIDPTTGEPRKMTSLEYMDRQVSQIDETGRNVLLIPKVSPDEKIDIGTLTTGNNFASSFVDTLNYIDQQMVNSLYVPLMYVNVRASPSGEEIIERSIDQYQRSIEVLRNDLLRVFIRQVLYPVQQWNFNRESSYVMPEFNVTYGERAEDRVATMQVVRGLVGVGSLNPTKQVDYNLIRQLLNLPTRDLYDDEIEFIKQINKAIPPGRPPGTTQPQINPRPKTKKNMKDPNQT